MTQDYWEIIKRLQEPQNLSLGWELERRVAENKDKTALVYQDEIISYQQLNAGANRYADCFSRLGFKKGDVVVLFMKNRPEFLMAATGLSKLGVIVSLVHIGIRKDVLAHDINICEPRAVIVGYELIDVFNEVLPLLKLRAPALILIDSPSDHELPASRMQALGPLLQSSSEENPSATVTINSDDPLVYLYTPGQSGLRKAVAISQQSCLIKSYLYSMLGYMQEKTVQYMCLPLHNNGGFVGAYSAMITSGSTMVLKQKFSVHNFFDDLRFYGADYVIAVGEMARYLYNQPPRENDRDNPLQVMVCNGMWGSLVEAFRERFDVQHIIEVYTKTEGVGIFVNFEEVPGMCGNLSLRDMRQGEVVQYDYSNKQIKRNSAGRAIKCVPGESGLLVCEINQLNRFAGYINDPSSTEEVLLSNVFAEGDRYFNSGDLVQLHEKDYISYVDRLGDTYRWKGRTVSANQVADVLQRFYGGIEDVIVYAVKVPDVEGRCGMASLKLIEGEQLNWAEFIKHINRRMPEHARPVFIRIADQLAGGQDSEEYKEILRYEGFNPGRVKDPLYFLHPELEQYLPLDMETYKQILAQEIKL
ncbi:AMP-dependent synthetase/ligase [Syntrophomonas zehnderi OL-4]|uniref:AMP-dependent synthetase/ligase n=2 Tax=Syntrophomonas TaxID=862 RepID=A0A0E4C895_9FIRM|nr:AMP-dependent synthetase/ligase [Syntrophomonas zehnderi OL-4]CFX34436.1 AMP-dependent synthetase/ligase [Syntrophomonas zehnderi OL-4]